MPKKSVVFIGGKAIGAFCLEYLILNQDALGIDLMAVATKLNRSLDSEKTVLNLAKDNSIPFLCGAKDIPSCDLIISVQYHEILKQEEIDKAELAVNLHMAPLPEYRGCNQFSFAIVDRKEKFGTTLHKMTSGIDDGDIIAERRFEINAEIWVEELYELTVRESQKLFKNNIANVIAGNYELTSQASLIENRGSSFHYRKEIKDLKVLDESWSDEKKKLHVRATYMTGFEAPYSIVNGEKKYYNKNSF